MKRRADRSLWSRLSPPPCAPTADSARAAVVGPTCWSAASIQPPQPSTADSEPQLKGSVGRPNSNAPVGRTSWSAAGALAGFFAPFITPASVASRIPLADARGSETPILSCDRKVHSTKRTRGFTLLEALVATVIMGIAVSGILSGLAAASRNASRLTDYDRATLLARHKMDELLVDRTLPRNSPMAGVFDPALVGGGASGWNAIIAPFDAVPGSGPGNWVVDRVQLEVWWMSGATRHSFTLEGFRRGVLQPGESLPGGSVP